MNDDPDKLRAAAAARPGDPVVRARLAAVLATTGDGEADETARKAVQLARTCLEVGIAQPAHEAAALLYEVFREDPLATEVAILLADATVARAGHDDVVEARRLLSAIVASHPDALGARLRAAALALGLGDASEARGWVEPVARASAQTRTLYVQALLALGAIDEAAAEARAGIEAIAATRTPTSADDAAQSVLQQLVGVAELTRGDVEAAIEAFAEGVRLGPEDPAAYYNLALAFEASGSAKAALGVCDAGLELAPNDARLVALKARLATSP